MPCNESSEAITGREFWRRRPAQLKENMLVTINCPVCNEEDAVTVDRYNDLYGADADGNRGMRMTCYDLDSQTCDCDLDDEDFTDLVEDSI